MAHDFACDAIFVRLKAKQETFETEEPWNSIQNSDSMIIENQTDELHEEATIADGENQGEATVLRK